MFYVWTVLAVIMLAIGIGSTFDREGWSTPGARAWAMGLAYAGAVAFALFAFRAW